MSYQPHALLSWGGQSGSSVEEWSCGIRGRVLKISNSTLETDPDECLDFTIDTISAMVDDIATFHTTGLLKATGKYIDWVKFQPIAPNGRYYPGQATNQWLTADHGGRINGVTGGGPVSVQPFQSALVITLDSNIRRGRASHGRIYYPCGRPTDIGSGKCFGGNSEQQDLANVAAAMITAFGTNHSATHRWQPSVMSSDQAGTSRQIYSVRVGDVMDTQRRRRRQLPEVYVAADVL